MNAFRKVRTNFKINKNKTVLPDWNKIVAENATKIYRFAYSLTGNIQDAEDLTQETFIKAFKSWNTYRPGVLGNWLNRIAANLFLDNVRSKANKIKLAASDDIANMATKTSMSTDKLVSEFDPILQSALNSLAPEYKIAVILRDVFGYSYEAIAATLGIRIGTVRSRIHRGRKIIKTYLTQTGYLVENNGLDTNLLTKSELASLNKITQKAPTNRNQEV